MAAARQILDQVVTEKAFMATVVEMAQRLGWLTYHTHDSRRSTAGFPDLVAVRRGRLVFAELKSGGGVISTEQEVWLAALQACRVHFAGVSTAGPEVYIWRPTGMDSIEAVLR